MSYQPNPDQTWMEYEKQKAKDLEQAWKASQYNPDNQGFYSYLTGDDYRAYTEEFKTQEEFNAEWLRTANDQWYDQVQPMDVPKDAPSWDIPMPAEPKKPTSVPPGSTVTATGTVIPPSAAPPINPMTGLPQEIGGGIFEGPQEGENGNGVGVLRNPLKNKVKNVNFRAATSRAPDTIREYRYNPNGLGNQGNNTYPVSKSLNEFRISRGNERESQLRALPYKDFIPWGNTNVVEGENDDEDWEDEDEYEEGEGEEEDYEEDEDYEE